MAVALDAVGPSSAGALQLGGGATTLTWTHTNVGSGVALFVGVALGINPTETGASLSAKLDPAGANTTIPSLGTARHSNDDVVGFIQLFGLPNVSSGAHTITITLTGAPTWDVADSLIGGSASYTGADTTTAFSAQQSTAGNTSATPSLTFTGSTAGNMVAGAICNGAAITSVTSGTERWERNGSTGSAAGNSGGADIAGGGSVALTWSVTSDWYAIAAVEVLAAAAAATESNQWEPRPFVGPVPRLMRTGVRQPFQLMGDREVAAGTTPISLSDTAAADDALTAAVAAPLADTAAGADALSVAAALALADTASASDALTVAAAIPLSDAAAAADDLALTAAVPLAETAAADDALVVSAALTLSDTAAADDALTAGVPIALSDTASASDSLSVAVALPLAETATGDDSLSVFAPGVVDAYQAPRRVAGMFLSPSAAAFQLAGSSYVAPSGDQSISLTDTASAADSLTSAAAVPLTETASAADALAVTVALALADTASAVESLTAGVPISFTDTASALDALSVQITAQDKTLTDTASAADALSVTVALALADTASAVDAISIPEAPAAAVVSRITTGHQMSRAGTGTDARRVSTGTQMSRASTGTDARRIATGHQMSRIVSSQEE